MKKLFMVILISYLSLEIFLMGRYFYYGGQPIRFWLSVFLVIFSVLSLCGIQSGICRFLSVRNICKNGVSAKAVIKDYHVEHIKMKTYYPVIQFLDDARVSHTYQSRVGMSLVPRKYRKGRKVNIVYMPDEPHEFAVIPAYYYQAVIEILMFALIGIPSVLGSVSLLIC